MQPKVNWWLQYITDEFLSNIQVIKKIQFLILFPVYFFFSWDI